MTQGKQFVRNKNAKELKTAKSFNEHLQIMMR